MGTLQVEQWRPRLTVPPSAPISTNFDELSMERSKSFVNALQELKSLRPQLYSAAEYCQKSYLHNEQKQIVLDNLKHYAVGALVNAVDHLGTVAYKLTDLFEEQSFDISKLELSISRLDQKIHTCRRFTDIEGLRQQQLLAPIPRHHKHYILPSTVNATGSGRSGGYDRISSVNITPPSKTLSWHLASESNSEKKESKLKKQDDSEAFHKTTPEDFHLLEAVKTPAPAAFSQPVATKSVSLETTITAAVASGAITNTTGHQNKSVLSGFFTKNKHSKQKV